MSDMQQEMYAGFAAAGPGEGGREEKVLMVRDPRGQEMAAFDAEAMSVSVWLRVHINAFLDGPHELLEKLGQRTIDELAPTWQWDHGFERTGDEGLVPSRRPYQYAARLKKSVQSPEEAAELIRWLKDQPREYDECPMD